MSFPLRPPINSLRMTSFGRWSAVRLDALYPKEDVKPGEVILSVKNLRRAGVFKDISFNVRQGGSLSGSLVSLAPAEARLLVRYLELTVWIVAKSPLRDVLLASKVRKWPWTPGIGFVPEDRQQQGLVMELSVLHNATLTVLGRLKRLV